MIISMATIATMTTRMEDLFGFQLHIASYLHTPELPALKEVSYTLCDLVTVIENHVTFYGLKLPCETTDPLFYDLFHQNYVSFESRLQAKEDLHIQSNYFDKDASGRFTIPSMYRANVYNKRWNNFTLMEVAYMLGDVKAYQLLIQYNRNTSQKTSDFATNYTNDACNLLEVFGESKKSKKIRALRPHYSQ